MFPCRFSTIMYNCLRVVPAVQKKVYNLFCLSFFVLPLWWGRAWHVISGSVHQVESLETCDLLDTVTGCVLVVWFLTVMFSVVIEHFKLRDKGVNQIKAEFTECRLCVKDHKSTLSLHLLYFNQVMCKALSEKRYFFSNFAFSCHILRIHCPPLLRAVPFILLYTSIFLSPQSILRCTSNAHLRNFRVSPYSDFFLLFSLASLSFLSCFFMLDSMKENCLEFQNTGRSSMLNHSKKRLWASMYV